MASTDSSCACALASKDGNDLPPPTPLTNLPQPILLKVFHFVGPKYTRLSIGSTCHTLRDLSSSDFLWTQFWQTRCHRPEDHRGGTFWKSDNGGNPPTEDVMEKYIELHARVLPKPTCEVRRYTGQGVVTTREPVDCTYEYKTRLTPDDEMDLCGREATIWCDFEDCIEARCRSQDCPEDQMYYWHSQERMEFITCSFCRMKACPTHAKKYGWPRPCSLCNVTSCNDCISETLVSQTTLQCQHWDQMYMSQCKQNLCANCKDGVCVEKLGDFDTKVTAATKDDICQAASEATAAIEEGTYDKLIYGLQRRICCKPCGETMVKRLEERRERHTRMEEERLEQLDYLTPNPRLTSRALRQSCNEELRSMRWAFGTFLMVDLDSKMRGGKLCLGVCKGGFVSGFLILPKMERDGKFTGEIVDENNPKTFDFVGFGAAWSSDDSNYEEHHPRHVDDRDDCIEISGEIAPGPLYSFRYYGNMGTDCVLRAERVDQEGKALLKCTLTVPRDVRCQIFFTGIPETMATKIEPVSLHDLAEVESAGKKLNADHLKIKAKRRKRMEDLMKKYPGAGLSYEQGDSSDSEVDHLNDDDMIPPWAY